MLQQSRLSLLSLLTAQMGSRSMSGFAFQSRLYEFRWFFNGLAYHELDISWYLQIAFRFLAWLWLSISHKRPSNLVSTIVHYDPKMESVSHSGSSFVPALGFAVFYEASSYKFHVLFEYLDSTRTCCLCTTHITRTTRSWKSSPYFQQRYVLTCYYRFHVAWIYTIIWIHCTVLLICNWSVQDFCMQVVSISISSFSKGGAYSVQGGRIFLTNSSCQIPGICTVVLEAWP